MVVFLLINLVIQICQCYLYYNSKLKSWMVASYVGNEYAWMKYQLSDGEEQSSEIGAKSLITS